MLSLKFSIAMLKHAPLIYLYGQSCHGLATSCLILSSEFIMSESCFSATFREIFLPSSGKVCECVCGIYVFSEDRNILRSQWAAQTSPQSNILHQRTPVKELKNTSQPSSLQVKEVKLQSTAVNTIMTLTGNIRKCWTSRKTRKQEPSRKHSTQKKTVNGISFKLPNIWKPILRESKAKQTTIKTTTSSNWVHKCPPTSMVPYRRSATKINQSETTLKYFDPLRTHKYHRHTHTPRTSKDKLLMPPF